MINTLIGKLRSLGPQRFVQAGLSVAVNLVLQKIYRFDPWHIGGNYYSRPYKTRVVKLAERDRPATIVEIGAGLGDIIGRVKATHRVGLDLDQNVIKAARHLLPRDVKLAQANFLDADSVVAALRATQTERVDCLIMVNWIHMIAMDDIVATLDRITQSVPIRRVLVDAIKSGNSGYRHHHDARALARLGTIVETVQGDDVRDLILVELHTRH